MKVFLPAALLFVSGCQDEQPPAPSAEQSSQLNEADSMLNGLANEEGPADHSAGPSNSND